MKILSFIQRKFGGKNYGKFLPTKFFYKHLYPKKGSSWCEYEGMKFYIGEKDTAGYSIFDFEFYEREIMKQNIKEGDIVIDLGANIGFYTCLFSKWVGKTGKVYAFEPEDNNFKILTENVKRNNCENVKLFNYAVSDKERTDSLFISDRLGEHGIIPNESLLVQPIETIILDNHIKLKVDFIKMDIEGWEAHALRGMKQLIKNNPNIKIFSEFSPSMLKKSGIDSEEYLEELEDLGFKIEWINQNKSIKKLNIDSKDSTNILCKRL